MAGHICPVCGQYYFNRKSYDKLDSSFSCCGICGWIDDALLEYEPDSISSKLGVSLNQAKIAWNEKDGIPRLKVRYLATNSLSFIKGQIYYVMSVELGWYRIYDTFLMEDYLNPPHQFKIIDNSTNVECKSEGVENNKLVYVKCTTDIFSKVKKDEIYPAQVIDFHGYKMYSIEVSKKKQIRYLYSFDYFDAVE